MNQTQMTPMQALELLYKVAGLAPVTRQDHQAVDYAVQLLESVLKGDQPQDEAPLEGGLPFTGTDEVQETQEVKLKR